jgi:hypothetical protein
LPVLSAVIAHPAANDTSAQAMIKRVMTVMAPPCISVL